MFCGARWVNAIIRGERNYSLPCSSSLARLTHSISLERRSHAITGPDVPKSTITSTPFSSILRTSSSKSGRTGSVQHLLYKAAELTLLAVIDGVHLSSRQLVQESDFIGSAGSGEHLVGSESDCRGKR